MPLDSEALRLLAHVDQTKETMRDIVKKMPHHQLAKIIKTCAKGDIDSFDERYSLFVGMLAVTAIYTLLEPREMLGD